MRLEDLRDPTPSANHPTGGCCRSLSRRRRAVAVVGTSLRRSRSRRVALGAGGEYHPVTPARVLDTRVANSPSAGAHRFAAPFDVQLAGANTLDGTPSGIPASGVLAVVANITVVDPQQPGFLTAYPSGTSLPLGHERQLRAGAERAQPVARPAGHQRSDLDLSRPGSRHRHGARRHRRRRMVLGIVER